MGMVPECGGGSRTLVSGWVSRQAVPVVTVDGMRVSLSPVSGSPVAWASN